MDASHAKVARWLVDEREITPEYWNKITPTEQKAYIDLAGVPIAKGDTAYDLQEAGILKELQKLYK